MPDPDNLDAEGDASEDKAEELHAAADKQRAADTAAEEAEED